MNKPAVSIIVCCYNSAQTLARTGETLSAQSFTDIEIIAIDDGSTDATQAVLQNWKRTEKRLRVLENPGNKGTAYSRQRGLEEASAELVMFVDADDLAEPSLVKRLHETLISDRALLGVSCYTTYFVQEGKALGVQRIGPTSRAQFQTLYEGNKMVFIAPCTLFRKVDAFAAGGYRHTLMPNVKGIRYEDFCEDLDLWCRMSDHGANGRYFLTLPESLLQYRKPATSVSTNNVHLMQLKMRWIKDCLRRRRAGSEERSLAEFIGSRNLLERFADWRADRAASYYKQAGFAYSQRKFAVLAWYLLLAGMMSPKLIRQKIVTQGTSR